MAKSKAQKTNDVVSLVTKLQEAKGVVFVNYKGLTVKEIEELRRELRSHQIDYIVSKKTLTNIALGKAGYQEVDAKKLPGQLAVVFGFADEILPAKLLYKFSRTHASLVLSGGILDKKFLMQNEIVYLAQLPTRPELLAKLLGSIKAPLTGLINVLHGNLRSLVYVLKAIGESKN